jgi:hypothetical protein
MALLEQAVYSRLSNHAGLTTLVGTRIYPIRLPQRPTIPGVTYRVISARRFSAMAVDVADVETRVQVDAWSDKFNDATRGVMQIAAQIRAALVRWMGTTAGLEIQDCYFENEVDFYEEGVDAPHRRSSDFRVYYLEA